MRTRFARVKELAGADSEKFAEEEVRKSRERLFALYACIRAPVIRDPVARRRHGNGEKVGFCPQKRAKSGICGSSRRDLPTCVSACVIERKRRLSRGLRRFGKCFGALLQSFRVAVAACAYAKIFRRPRVVWRARASDTRVRKTADEAFCVRARLWRRCKIGSRAALAASRSGRQNAKRRSEGVI